MPEPGTPGQDSAAETAASFDALNGVNNEPAFKKMADGTQEGFTDAAAALAAANVLKTPGNNEVVSPDGSPVAAEIGDVGALSGASKDEIAGSAASNATPPVGSEYDYLFADGPDTGSVEDAAVRSPLPTTTTSGQEAARQASIAAADRKNRDDAGLPPRTYDLT